MKNLLIICLALIFLISCKSTPKTPLQMIAGDNQKTWNADKETDSQGDKDHLTRSEKKESITFNHDGTMSMKGENEMKQGKWSYEGSTLSLIFSGEGVSENFTVQELTDKNMKLRAADGSEMVLKPD